jgi:proteic killer suppression protein
VKARPAAPPLPPCRYIISQGDSEIREEDNNERTLWRASGAQYLFPPYFFSLTSLAPCSINSNSGRRERRISPRGGRHRGCLAGAGSYCRSLDLDPICDTYSGVIRSFADKRTAAIWADRVPKGFPGDLAKAARRKLRMVAAAVRLEDLRNPPGNRLEALVGERAGQYSIRVNDQWRLCFVRREGEAYDVEIVDYH